MTSSIFHSQDALPSHAFPRIRQRRTRSTPFLRALVQENSLSTADLILPLFIQEGSGLMTPVPSMPGVHRRSIDQLLLHCEAIQNASIPAIILFPYIALEQKSALAEEAFNPEGLVQRAVRQIKNKYPQLGVITDIALDPYTSHGQDGLIGPDGSVLNDETLKVLAQQALSHARAGADIVAPSDMMDGRIGFIRDHLENNNFTQTSILSYAAKYASSFYGPFRDAVGSSSQLGQADKKTYQLDPGNSNEAVQEALLDVGEGADLLMVKPGMPYLDILYRVKQATQMPVLAYQVSGEFSMLHNAILQGILPESALMEAIIAFKRAGADAIVTYGALEIAKQLKL